MESTLSLQLSSILTKLEKYATKHEYQWTQKWDKYVALPLSGLVMDLYRPVEFPGGPGNYIKIHWVSLLDLRQVMNLLNGLDNTGVLRLMACTHNKQVQLWLTLRYSLNTHGLLQGSLVHSPNFDKEILTFYHLAHLADGWQIDSTGYRNEIYASSLPSPVVDWLVERIQKGNVNPLDLPGMTLLSNTWLDLHRKKSHLDTLGFRPDHPRQSRHSRQSRAGVCRDQSPRRVK